MYKVTDTNNRDADLATFPARDTSEAELLGKEHANAARVVVYRLWVQQSDGAWLRV